MKVMANQTSRRAAWLIAAASFAFCVAPSFISYKPYQFSWDDSEYLARAIAVSHAFWSGDAHRVGAAMVSAHTPIMSLMDLAGGLLPSWDAVGNCFFTLAVVISALAAISLYMLLRIGVKPILLVVASLCVAVALVPYATGTAASAVFYRHALVMGFAADNPTGFMADNLLAWVALVSVLFIPYEMNTPVITLRSAVLRGMVCASILTLGALTKVSFFYFIVLILPLLIFARFRSGEVRSGLAWLIAFACCCAPTAIYFLRYGESAFALGKASSVGDVASYYYVPIWRFLADNLRESPGLLLCAVFVTSASLFYLIKRRLRLLDPNLLAFLIMIGFLVVLLAAPNKQSRFLFTLMVGLPFLTSLLISGEEDSVVTSPAGYAGVIVFLCFVAAALPMRHRPYQPSLTRSEAVLAQASRHNMKTVVLATDSPTLNLLTLRLASELSGATVSIHTLAYQAMSGISVKDDFHAIDESDMVVFQDPRSTSPSFTNQRVSEYRAYVSRVASGSIKIADDISAYVIHGHTESAVVATSGVIQHSKP